MNLKSLPLMSESSLPSWAQSPTEHDVTEPTLALLKRHSVQFFGEDELRTKLKKRKRLFCKAGFDPTAPDLHLGHTLLLKLLFELSKLGHLPIFVVGDYTAKIGDPSGKSKTRPPLSDEMIAKNAKSYAKQAFCFLDEEKSALVFNGSWLSRLSFSDTLRLSSLVTVAQMLEREDFTKRYQAKVPISLHEFLYPLMQGYDSVAMKADIEFGGTDQTFNLLVGRDLQRSFEQVPQAVATLPLLVGLDGEKKMSKSLGNFIGVTESSKEVYGKSMSIPDSLILDYQKLLLDAEDKALAKMKARLEQGENPKNLKSELAFALVCYLHDEKQANEAKKAFEQRFVKKVEKEEEAPLVEYVSKDGELGLASALVILKFCRSNSEAFRLIEQGAVFVNHQKVLKRSCILSSGSLYFIKCGKLRRSRLKVL